MQGKDEYIRALENVEIFEEALIYPETEHNLEIKAKRAHEADQIRQEKEEMRKKKYQADQDKHLQQLEEQKAADKARKEKEDEERKKQEEMDQRSKLVNNS